MRLNLKTDRGKRTCNLIIGNRREEDEGSAEIKEENPLNSGVQISEARE